MSPPDRAKQKGYNPNHFAKGLHNSVVLMPGAIAGSFCCKAEGHQACGAGDGGLNFAKSTATPPYCALLALRHIHACRNTFGQMNITCGRTWKNQLQWGMETLALGAAIRSQCHCEKKRSVRIVSQMSPVSTGIINRYRLGFCTAL